MHAFDVVGDPVRRRLLELLSEPGVTARSAGELTAAIMVEFGITQPAVSKHLKVLRDNGFATVEADGSRRLYAVRSEPLTEIDAWLARYRPFWTNRLDALDTEIARGHRARRKDQS
jgi:DNA-binding transcriptional ArsR family regulator